MNCRRFQSSLAEDLLNQGEERVAAHLKECEECRAVYSDLLEIEELSRSLSGRVQVPPNFREEVLAKVARKRRSRPFRLVAAVAGVVLLAATVSFFQGVESVDSTRHKGGRPDKARPAEPTYVDVIVTGEENEEFILRLPSVIEVRRTELQEDFYISNVSH
jgi:predicted anti-sigma-YlaC factor YlaD